MTSSNRATSRSEGAPFLDSVCRATGLPVEQRAEWRDVELEVDYRCSFAVIGRRVLLVAPRGHAGRVGMPRLFEKRREVLQQAGLWERPYCEIKDYTGVSLQHPRLGRMQFADLLYAEYERGFLKGFWGYGGPRVFRWIMTAAKALSDHPDGPVYFVADYASAVSQALSRLDEPGDAAGIHPPRRVRRDDWSVQAGGYAVTFEVWDDSILFGRARGRLSRSAAPHLFDMMERILDERDLFPDGSFAQLSDLSQLDRVDWNGLRYIQQRYLKIHERHPCRGVVAFGPNGAFQAVARLARTVFPFPYLIKGNAVEALRAVRSLPRLDPRPPLFDRLRGERQYSEQELTERVAGIIQYAGGINWHDEGLEEPVLEPGDPLAPLYALLRVLKLDFDNVQRDRQRLQEEMLQAAKLSSIGRLTAGLAHELNSPLTAVFGYIEQIQRNSSDPRSIAHAERALRGARRLRDLIDQLAAYSRTRPPIPPRRLDLNECVEESLGLIAPLLARRGVEVQRELAPGLPAFEMDPTQLHSVLTNVITNAFDAYEAGAAEETGDGERPVRITTRREGDWVVIECRDWGCGMSAEAVENAFDPFFTTKDIGAGTGLGLYVTHHIVTTSGGRIQLSSAPAAGTTVTIRWPAEVAEASPPDRG